MLTMGIDPDLHYTSVVIARQLRPVWVSVTSVSAKLRGVDAVQAVIREMCQWNWPGDAIEAIAIEGQQKYGPTAGHSRGSKVDPADLLKLALVSGAVLAMVISIYPNAKCFVPLPSMWKGQVPKSIHNRRVLNRAAVTFTVDEGRELIIPQWPDSTTVNRAVAAGQANHAIDALGLAQYVDNRVS